VITVPSTDRIALLGLFDAHYDAQSHSRPNGTSESALFSKIWDYALFR